MTNNNIDPVRVDQFLASVVWSWMTINFPDSPLRLPLVLQHSKKKKILTRDDQQVPRRIEFFLRPRPVRAYVSPSLSPPKLRRGSSTAVHLVSEISVSEFNRFAWWYLYPVCHCSGFCPLRVEAGWRKKFLLTLLCVPQSTTCTTSFREVRYWLDTDKPVLKKKKSVLSTPTALHERAFLLHFLHPELTSSGLRSLLLWVHYSSSKFNFIAWCDLISSMSLHRFLPSAGWSWMTINFFVWLVFAFTPISNLRQELWIWNTNSGIKAGSWTVSFCAERSNTSAPRLLTFCAASSS